METIIPPIPKKPFWCPRCDRAYKNEEDAKVHVAGQHPDHDPDWFDTYPEPYGN